MKAAAVKLKGARTPLSTPPLRAASPPNNCLFVLAFPILASSPQISDMGRVWPMPSEKNDLNLAARPANVYTRIDSRKIALAIGETRFSGSGSAAPSS